MASFYVTFPFLSDPDPKRKEMPIGKNNSGHESGHLGTPLGPPFGQKVMAFSGIPELSLTEHCKTAQKLLPS